MLEHAPEAPRHDFAAVTPERWRALAAKRLFFGHQSVGGNLMDGVAAVLAAHPAIPLRVFDAAILDSTAAPGIYHARIGRNGDPGSKADAFAQTTDAARPGVAMLKYCYVDVTGDTDPDALFADYQRRIADLRARHPGLTVVHVTMPLTTIEGRREVIMAKLRGRATKRDLNLIRNRYNQLLRQAYVGREPVFDLARFESTRPDGSRAFFTRGRDSVYIMARERTNDGGHLHPAAQREAAEEFLALLASL